MQRNSCKINEIHVNTIALKARLDNQECGYLWKRSSESNGKWQMKWFALYQNFLFYYENVNSTKPLGLILLESCYCNRIITNTKNTKEGEIKLYCFSISFTKDNKNSIEFGAQSEDECIQWIESIQNCSYNRQVSLNAELEEKYLHLRQLYDTECATKWEHLSQIEELSNEVKSIREEIKVYKKHSNLQRQKTIADEEPPDIKRLKKVQSLCKGWLYRKRWKRIVKDYIESPDALNLRKRNRIVFDLVEKEGEYMSQLEVLVSNFLRPFKMAACSSKAPITHEEVNCIFLNSEILLFLHQIFYKGLRKKLENWPTLFIGDLFDFLLPVLVIYQEYVRNHHYSLQILTDLKSKSSEFRNLLKRYESKCEGRALETYLTYPMHQIPRYILILHELIAHTNKGSTNELNSLENAKIKLEELSRTMHDEVSETENIRCNLAIEKMIVEGCEVLLDSNQLFIREGLLIILLPKSKSSSVKLKDLRKRTVVKCFLFSNHLIVTTRASNGRLNLFKPYESVPLNECKLIEDLSNEFPISDDENSLIISDDRSMSSMSIVSNTESTISFFFNNKEQPNDNSNEFKLIQSNNNFNRTIHFIASSLGEKQSWCGDISQCLDNLNYSRLFDNGNSSNSVNMPNKELLTEDSKLFKDEKDVKYCKTLNSCKIPQIRQATPDKLIERLTDLRFLSIDFLNTFLLTYRIFTDSFKVFNALKDLYESKSTSNISFNNTNEKNNDKTTKNQRVIISNELNRRVSVSALFRLPSINEEDSLAFNKSRKNSILSESDNISVDYDRNKRMNPALSPISSLEPIVSYSNNEAANETEIKIECDDKNNSSSNKNNGFIGNVIYNVTKNVTDGIIFSNKKTSCSNKSRLSNSSIDSSNFESNSIDRKLSSDYIFSNDSLNDSISSAEKAIFSLNIFRDSQNNQRIKNNQKRSNSANTDYAEIISHQSSSAVSSPTINSKNFQKYSQSLTTNQLIHAVQQNAQKISKRFSEAFVYNKDSSKLKELQNKKLPINVFAGVVVTSSRSSRRRTSNCEAAKAFAVATSGSQTSLEKNHSNSHRHSTDNYKSPSNNTCRSDRLNSAAASIDTNKSKVEWTIVNTAASMRVLNVLRHWITKHPFDFDENSKLKENTIDLINQMLEAQELTDTESKVAIVLRKQLNIPYEKKIEHIINLDKLLAPPSVHGKVKFNELSVSEIAEQMTFIDHQILCSISSQELLGQAWMKPGKEINARNVLIFSRRFNEMSQLVVTEIVTCKTHEQRLEKLEKWTTIANICKFLKNFNGVLQIMSAFATTSVFRLKKTWDKLSKNSQQTIDTLQNLVSSDGRFKNLRDAMHKCDPPCIPYLGMYLMDLVFIEESTPDFIDGNLVNFSKLRMVSHIIRDLRNFQQIKYTIHHNRKVCEYILDTSWLLTPDEAYNRSLTLEPRTLLNKFDSSLNI